MATRVGTEDNPVSMLEHLMALDYDAIDAYQAAIERLDDSGYRQRMAEFKSDHERHVRELRPVIERMGGNPPEGPGAKSMLTQGKVAMANMGGDDAILRAMLSNEEDTNTAYDRAFEHAPTEAHDILARGREDEHRHYEWINQTLDTGSGRRKDSSRPGARPSM